NGMAIRVVPAFGGSEHRLYKWPFSPSARGLDWSPDGNVLAFSGGQTDWKGTWISLLSLVDSTTRKLTSPSGEGIDCSPACSLAWTPDGGYIVFSSARGGLASLWRVSASGGTPRPVAGVGVASSPSISPKGNQLAYTQSVIKENILRLDLKDEKHSQGPPAVL